MAADIWYKWSSRRELDVKEPEGKWTDEERKSVFGCTYHVADVVRVLAIGVGGHFHFGGDSLGLVSKSGVGVGAWKCPDQACNPAAPYVSQARASERTQNVAARWYVPSRITRCQHLPALVLHVDQRTCTTIDSYQSQYWITRTPSIEKCQCTNHSQCSLWTHCNNSSWTFTEEWNNLRVLDTNGSPIFAVQRLPA